MTTSPHFPIELHEEIRNHLHHHRDRSTLVAAALVNKEWRKGSQRILFSRMTDEARDRPDTSRVVSIHKQFLQTVIEHPQRLAPLVRSYAQHGLTFNPAASE